MLKVAAEPTMGAGLVGTGLLDRGTRTVEVALAVVVVAKAVAAVASKTAGPAVEVNRMRTASVVSVGVVVTPSGAPLCALLAIGCC